jgi:hypothetical protein
VDHFWRILLARPYPGRKALILNIGMHLFANFGRNTKKQSVLMTIAVRRSIRPSLESKS